MERCHLLYPRSLQRSLTTNLLRQFVCRLIQLSTSSHLVRLIQVLWLHHQMLTGHVKLDVIPILSLTIASVGFRLKPFTLCSISPRLRFSNRGISNSRCDCLSRYKYLTKLNKWYPGRLPLNPSKFSACVVRYLS